MAGEPRAEEAEGPAAVVAVPATPAEPEAATDREGFCEAVGDTAAGLERPGEEVPPPTANGAAAAASPAAATAAASGGSSSSTAAAGGGGKGKADEKQTTLASALMKKENRGVARTLVFFATALAVIPVVGLVCCERLLRDLVPDKTTRWTYSGIAAVVLVNFVMVLYVVHCFFEQLPPEEAPKKPYVPRGPLANFSAERGNVPRAAKWEGSEPPPDWMGLAKAVMEPKGTAADPDKDEVKKER
uniref:Uncharacterized protein n=1 Tax=Alexandrium catenella TaxID=2925 RepID=A0A7S1QM52_ALECA|mmetsp:Transcript_35044/g.94985  ORF Transcript_35044/g.94985 Transcript_35044/m.94985 type:complete len:244 (+) Transcript_35044:104-835(+)|eukprot:CAMPEP_0171217782 /NCGR_PEP_ID=MMETSP0790-20130122/32867_1 /TAXON_ID=2925 /ORGANISM="Alexandrium catenella, Strain OF101" /LENGTH=243 /DNA_ID=CAMNT_0011683591 /DNA_START=18 /DNA_END=749 /DNA_ORIENTATION=+